MIIMIIQTNNNCMSCTCVYSFYLSTYTHTPPPLQVCDESLHSVRSHEQGRLLACGSHSGSITLLELSDFLCTLQPSEKANVTTVSSTTRAP